ncbi:hypothetical protein MRX96_031344 [Rhipicephalus microplus]
MARRCLKDSVLIRGLTPKMNHSLLKPHLNTTAPPSFTSNQSKVLVVPTQNKDCRVMRVALQKLCLQLPKRLQIKKFEQKKIAVALVRRDLLLRRLK